jgi:carbon-monoxide dehydrogenase medium subunit
MNDFTFHAPDTLDEALALLSQHNGDAKVMAGGTALTTLLKQSLIAPDHIVSLHRIQGLDSIEASNGTLNIGGLVTQRSMETSAVVKENAPLLAEAYRRVATIRIRNVATVGGGIAQADPAMDPPPSLLILGASVVATSSRGQRTIPISEVYADYYETTLEPDEIVTQVQVPVQPSGAAWTYIKYLPRTEDDYATVSVAAIGRLEDGKVADVRVALGAVASTAVRASNVEEALMGQTPTAEMLREVSQAVTGIVDPTDDPRGSAWYKRDMSAIFTRRALEKVLGIEA